MYAPIHAGDTLAGKYRVERVLGMGGMGVVLAATHLKLEEQVAIKLLLPDLVEQPEALVRFLGEAKAAAKIRSRHVARVFDFGTMEDGAPFIVMELLEGLSAAAVLRRGGKLEPAVAAEYVLQACDAIGEAHAAGIIHRDLKPANLFVCVDTDGTPLVKVLDFGVSKIAGEGHDVTTTASLLGSPSYMAPEQMSSAKNVDERADIWSLGTILYEFVTGQKPFRGDNVPALCMLIMNEMPRRPSEIVGDLPPGFEGVILRCLEKAKEHRFASIADLEEALAPFAGEAREVPSGSLARRSAASEAAAISASLGEPTVVDTPAALVEASSAGVVTDSRKAKVRAPWWRSAVVAAALLGAGGIAIVSWVRSSGFAEPAPAPSVLAAPTTERAAEASASSRAEPPPPTVEPVASASASASPEPTGRGTPAPKAPGARRAPKPAGTHPSEAWKDRKW